MSSTFHSPTIIEAPQEPSTVKPLHLEDHAKSSSSTQMSKSDPNPSSPTTSVKSIEVGNLLITLKKDPLKALDSAILETSNSFYDDRLYQSAKQALNPHVSAWSNPLPRVRNPLKHKDISKIKSFHPNSTQYSSIQTSHSSYSHPKAQSNYQPPPPNYQRSSYHQESHSGLARSNFRSYPQHNVDAHLYERQSQNQSRTKPQPPSYPKPYYQKENINPNQGFRNDPQTRNRNFKNTHPGENRMFENSMKILPEEIKLKIGMPPLKPQSAYRLFVQDKYSELKKANPELKHHEISKKANDLWLYQTSTIDKEAYEHKYEECMRDFRLQCENYKKNKTKVLTEYNESKKETKNASEDGSKDSKLKFRTAYKLFKIDYVQYVKEKYPDSGFKERADILKNIWKGLSPHSKYLYVKRSRLDKKRAMLEKTVETILQVQKEKDSNIKPKAPNTTQQPDPKGMNGGNKAEEEKVNEAQETKVLQNGCYECTKSMGNQLDDDDDPDDEDYIPDEEELDSEEDEIDEEIEGENREAEAGCGNCNIPVDNTGN